MDSGAISHNRRLERHSKHAARHPSPAHDFSSARPAHLAARDAALDAIIRDVEDSEADQGADFDLQRRLGPGLFGDGDDGDDDDDGPSGSQSGSNSGSNGGNNNGNGRGSSSSSPTFTGFPSISKGGCSRGPDGVCLESTTSVRSTSSIRTTSSTPTTTSERTTSSTRSTSTTPTSTSSSSTRTTSSSVSTFSRTTSSSSSSTSSTPTSSASSTLLFTANGTTRTSVVAIVTAINAPQESSSVSSADDGPGAGPIVGIVAGSLAGVAILSAIIGFIWKKYSKKSEDEYEGNPFGGDRDDFRRGSTMLQDDNFDEDEFGAPSMSEHGNGGINQGHGSYGAEGVMAGAAGMGAMAGAGMMARNESGAPRPPTMFARHLAQVNSNAAPPMPNNTGMYEGGDLYEDAYPQLPPMAFNAGGGVTDPYSMNQNISNPYAHLDRAQAPQETGYYSNLDRSGSQGSQQSNSQCSHHLQQQQQPQQPGQFAHQDSFTSAQEDEGDFDTAGRPGTSEGRSGTPDLPNMQQTYVMNNGVDSTVGHHDNVTTTAGRESVLSLNGNGNGHQSREMIGENLTGNSNNSTNEDPFNENNPINSGKANVSHQLSVRNLMPNPHENHQVGSNNQQNRPLSTVSSAADPEDIYGGIY